MKKNVFFAALLVLLLAALPAAAMEEIYYWPLAGTVKGTNVNVRGGPGTSFKAVGKVSGSDGAAALPVTGRADTGEEHPWYRVESRDFGQGWIYGRYLSAKEPLSAIERYSLRIKADYGLTPSLAVKKLGEPEGRENRKLHIPDFNLTVAETTLSYPGLEIVYWDGQLTLIVISGGDAAFGDIAPGMAVTDAFHLLGQPSVRDGDSLFFYRSDSAGGRALDQITLHTEAGSDGGLIAGLEYRFSIYD